LRAGQPAIAGAAASSMAAFEAARQADFGRIIRCRFWVFFPVDRSPQQMPAACRIQREEAAFSRKHRIVIKIT